MKKFLICSVIVFSFLLVGCSSKSNSTNSSTNSSNSTEIKITSPTTENNSNNDVKNDTKSISVSGDPIVALPIVKVGNNIYVSQWKDNNRLYEYLGSDINSINDLLKATKKYDLFSREMVQDTEKIYFTNISDNGNIYTLSDSTKEVKKLDNSKSSNITLGADGLYFINQSDNSKIYKINLSDNTKTAVIQDSVGKFLLFNDTIIYQNKNDKFKLYAYSLTDKTKTELTSNSAESFGVANNKLIYVNSGDQDSIWSLDLQSMEDKKLMNVEAENLQVISGRIFFINRSSGNYLNELISPANGTASTNPIINEGVEQYFISENTVYYESKTSHNDIKTYNIK
ncbi:DUF5050 domain-containing protein [Clostridium fungisolvens]|uniref:Prolow-density lipoprotein receptor-related protein 1-like beta-propeller domain-containing protein n=1 Tax=Clostridium fungisolvens TaxID=1604897 RepID=A0A6V8SMZ2_9CLOT|nr:DUF5050 domain-containing protein [Clostridium fungisolvens]GFP77932.1 hypothetical protein bsdtw1_04113 [Clostridium fungisolvens]